MTMNKGLVMSLVMMGMLISACSNDDEPKIPTDAISLNMMNESHGQTRLGGSDVYINDANNFTTDDCGLVDLGSKGSMTSNPVLGQISQEMAVAPGHVYQIMMARAVQNIAGERAYPINANYYNVYVDSWLYGKSNDITGAKVSYLECYPDAGPLPEWNSGINVKMIQGAYTSTAEYTFNDGVKIDSYNYSVYCSDSEIKLSVDVNDNRIKFIYEGWRAFKADVDIYVRYKNVYSKVYFMLVN